MDSFGVTESTCPECRRLVPAKIVSEDGQSVIMRKFCPEHGESQALVRSSVEDYLKTLRFTKSAWNPRAFAGDSSKPCPEGCGFCERHEQHLCMPIIEITSRCDLSCPICLASAGAAWDMSMDEFKRILDGILNAESQVDILNISGGEPLLHPQLLDFIDEALVRPGIIRTSVSTNGLAFLEKPELLSELRKRDVVVSLQFDGFDDEAYETMRGARLLERKLKLIELLKAEGLSCSLTMTLAKGLNDSQLRPVLDLFFSTSNFISLMLQPLSFAGRAASMKEVERLDISALVRMLGDAGHPSVTSKDFLPLPCSHPLCFSLAFYLMLSDGGTKSVNQLVEAETLMDSIANKVVFGLDAEEHERVKSLIYALWSGPAANAPDSERVLHTLRALLKDMSCTAFDPKTAFRQAERSVKSIFIHAFQDAGTFDISRVRKCCQAYPQVDGSLIPACVNNVLRRPVK